ncbi:MAG: hypothetical protein K0Q83_3982, partial [Deltaproteobacteria bacterium]|nr:hypothetical protein [Deltaproteobacteria bacterium]
MKALPLTPDRIRAWIAGRSR